MLGIERGSSMLQMPAHVFHTIVESDSYAILHIHNSFLCIYFYVSMFIVTVFLKDARPYNISVYVPSFLYTIFICSTSIGLSIICIGAVFSIIMFVLQFLRCCLHTGSNELTSCSHFRYFL